MSTGTVWATSSSPPATTASRADAHASVVGEADADQLSQVLFSADIDGDGIDEFICGTARSGDYEGAVYVEWGPIQPGTWSAGQADVRLRGSVGSWFGADAGTADLDGDGRTDLVVGAAGDHGRDGAVHLFSGTSLTGAPAEGLAADGLLVGEGGGFGGTIDPGGDRDGSGLPDLLVGAQGFGSGFAVPGRTYIFNDFGINDDTYAAAAVTLEGEGTSAYSGAARWLGDINGDGYEEALIGQGGLVGGAGRSFLFYGPISPDLTMHSEADASFDGEISDRLGGGGLSGPQLPEYRAGDADGDGYDDFMLPAFGNGTDHGRVYFFRGASGP